MLQWFPVKTCKRRQTKGTTMKTSTNPASITTRCGLRHAAAALLALSLASSASADSALVCTITPERGVLASGVPETAVVKVALTGGRVETQARPAVNLAIVLDRSGSMSGDKIVRAREAAIAAVSRLDERDQVSVVVFDESIDTIVPAQSAGNRESIVRRIQAIEARGSTAIFGGVSQAASEIRKNLGRGMVNRIILLSDGQANVGPASPHELGRLGAALVKEGVSVSTVGVGLDYNEDLMTSLSRQSDGNSYFVENSDDLPRIFSKELGDVLSVAAKDVRLKIHFKRGAVPVELIGRDGRISDGVVTVDFNQIYSGQEKYVLVKAEFAVGEDGERRDFATAEVSYRHPVSESRGTVAASGAIRFSRDAAVVKKSANVEVVKEVVYNINAVEMDRAVKLSDEGKSEESRQVFEANAERLEKAAKEYGINVAPAAQMQRDVAHKAAKGKLAPDYRKRVVHESYEITTQQSK